MTNSTTITTALPVGTWAADPIHSTAGFAVKHMVVATFRGRFERFVATLAVGDDGTARLDGSVDVASVLVKDENLEAHLMSPDFFDAELYPQLRFESTAIEADGDEVVVRGTMTIKGITQPVTGRGRITEPTEDADGQRRVGLSLEAVVDRRAYGLNWNQPLSKGGYVLANDVKLEIELSLVAQ
jgi:polyisoprenoid-binding protein YceI